MSTTRPFAYNPSLTPIGGTTQVGTLAIGYGPLDYSTMPGGVEWWNGPDEDLGYVVASPVPSDGQDTPIPGNKASVGFDRTNTFDAEEFIRLANKILNSNYTTAIDASTGLTYNGYWNNLFIVFGNGLTPETAGDNALQIKTDYPSSQDGLYWIKNNNISGNTPFQIYADMTTDGGGWTLLLTNQNTSGWTYSNSILLNEFNPVSGGSNYSIVAYADYLKSSGATFQYMIDAYQRNQFGGIWSAPSGYTFLNTNNTQTSITLGIKFGTWNYNDNSIEQRMPWRNPTRTFLSTSLNNIGPSWWGTLVSVIGSGSFNPAPWIDGDCGLDGCMPNPGIIWYWVR